MRSLGLKVLALFLACVVWFFVSAPRRERATERAFAAPLAIASLPRDLVITNQIPDTVSVRLRGRVSEVRALSSQNLEVTVDVSWVRAGEATITLRPQAINVPPDVDVISIEPNKLRFRVEPLRQKVVKVRALLIGTPPPGYRVGDPTIVPDQALISGPASQVKNLGDVATERIIMTGRTETFTQSAAVVSDSPFVRVVDPLAVQVTVPVLAEVGPPVPTTTTAPIDQ
ncbi:MAG TPA: CdaR family protein [Thermoanaerobaculia bacterium]